MTKTKLHIPEPHIVRPYGIFKMKGNTLKTYAMMPESKPKVNSDQCELVWRYIAGETAIEHIKPNSGLGFLIVSDGIANTCFWGGESSEILKQTIYSFNPKTLIKHPEFEKLSLEKDGTLCCWEAAIVGHESAAWRHYLYSPKSQADKKMYLDNMFDGLVID